MRDEPIKVLLVDDHEVIRIGLRFLLRQNPAIEVVGEAGTATEAVAQAARLKPDVVIMDVRLPDGNGVDACREIRNADSAIRVIMLTSYADEEAACHSIMAGASGYLLKEIQQDELLRAVAVVTEGQSLLDPRVTRQVLDKLTRSTSDHNGSTQLSAQEQKVLALIAEGGTNKEIAKALGLSPKTVKNYISHIFEKLNVSRRAEAAAFFARSSTPF